MTPNERNAWHVLKRQEMDDEGDAGGELVPTPLLTVADAKCQVGEEVIFRFNVHIRQDLSNPDAQFTGRVEQIFAGHEIVYAVRLFPPLKGIEGPDALFRVRECDCARVGW